MAVIKQQQKIFKNISYLAKKYASQQFFPEKYLISGREQVIFSRNIHGGANCKMKSMIYRDKPEQVQRKQRGPKVRPQRYQRKVVSIFFSALVAAHVYEILPSIILFEQIILIINHFHESDFVVTKHS